MRDPLFFDKVAGSDLKALHPKDGYYERRAYIVKDLGNPGAIISGCSDAPVNARDPPAVRQHRLGRYAPDPIPR